MAERIQAASIFIGRILVGSLFILSGISHVLNWESSVNMLLTLFADWSSYLHSYDWIKEIFIEIAPWTPWVLALAVLIELVGGVLFVLGSRTKLVAAFLILFLMVVTILCHQFWFLEGPQKDIEMAMFLKNFAIIGGLFFVLAHGAAVQYGGKSGLR